MNGLNPEAKEILIREGWKIAVAESLTGGLLQDFFVCQSGASAYFLGGITAYTVKMKSELLGVDSELAEACRGVSARVAQEMAMGIWRKFQADICLSTTGFAGPDLGPNGEQPLAYFALVFRGQVVAEGAVSEILERNHFRKLVAERAGAALENWLLSGGTSPDK